MESAAAAVVDALLASGGGVSPPSGAAMESAAAAVGGAVVASGGGVPPSNVADVGAVTSTSEKPVSRVISEQFSALSVGSKFTCGEAALEKFITSITAPYGIKLLVKPTGAHKNKDDSTKEQFPHRRFYYACGSCSTTKRDMDDTDEGCCGFKIRFLLQDKKDDGEPPHLEVREFKLPETSNHLLVSTNVRQVAQSNTITHEKQLTPNKVNLLHTLGKNRARANFATNMLLDHHGITLSKDLLHRVMRKGRDMAWGANESESLCIFYAGGLKLRQECDKLGVHGKFVALTANDTGMLLGWYAQHPLEVLNARVYGVDAVFMDTTHNATKYILKTGPPVVIDCFGFTAPGGICQVREEEIDSMEQMLAALELNAPGATLATDGGSSWSEVALSHDQHHIEDTWHNSENGDEKANVISNKKDKARFKELKNNVLYQFLSDEELNSAFAEMRAIAGDNVSLMNWIKRIDHGRTLRTATYTTKFFSCSPKGALSRCEQSMSRLKGKGLLKSEMKNWSLAELQNRHTRIVDDYTAKITIEIEAAIRKEYDLSAYVTDWENEERLLANDLEVVTVTENAPNPFHLMQSTRREKVTINMERPDNVAQLGLTLSRNLEVLSIADNSFFRGSMLEVGMRIYAVNGQTITSFNEGVELIKSTAGEFRLLVEKKSSIAIGTVYAIQRKGKGDDKKMLRTVFIPDSDDLHCQSDFHVHTCSWIRCRYIQRALMQHKTRSMNDVTTIHKRWRISNNPMYNIVRNNLAALMMIDGLGAASLPRYLAPITSAATAARNGDDDDKGDDDSIGATVPRIRAPNCKQTRYNSGLAITKQILDLAKANKDVYEMVMPQFNQMYQNCLLIAQTKSKKVYDARQQVAASGENLPIVPESIRGKDKSDDINLANKKGTQTKKGKKRKRTASLV